MDWDDESPAVPSPADPSHEEVASPETPVKTVTVSRTKWRLARAFSVLVLVLAIGAMGFILGHDVVKPAPIRSAAPRFTFPTFPSGVSATQLTVLPIPTTTPQNTKADAAAPRSPRKWTPAGRHHVDLRQPERHRRRHGHDLDLERLSSPITTSSRTPRRCQWRRSHQHDLRRHRRWLRPLRGRSAHPIEGREWTNDDQDRELRQRLLGREDRGHRQRRRTRRHAVLRRGHRRRPRPSDHRGRRDESGRVRAPQRLIEVNAAIVPGDSVTAVNDKGEVVGMDTAGSDLNGGFGFNRQHVG